MALPLPKEIEIAMCAGLELLGTQSGSWAQRSPVFEKRLWPFSLKSLTGARAQARNAPTKAKGPFSPQCYTVHNRALTVLVWLPWAVTVTL